MKRIKVEKHGPSFFTVKGAGHRFLCGASDAAEAAAKLLHCHANGDMELNDTIMGGAGEAIHFMEPGDVLRFDRTGEVCDSKSDALVTVELVRTHAFIDFERVAWPENFA